MFTIHLMGRRTAEMPFLITIGASAQPTNLQAISAQGGQIRGRGLLNERLSKSRRLSTFLGRRADGSELGQIAAFENVAQQRLLLGR